MPFKIYYDSSHRGNSEMDTMVAQQIVARTPLLSGVEKVEYLSEGFSSDRKYVLWDREGPRYLLRLSDIVSAPRRRTEFALLATLREGGVRCPMPHLFGITEDSVACYSLLSYIPGESARSALPRLSAADQYQIGFDAGAELRKLYKFRHPNQGNAGPRRRMDKYRRYVRDAHDLGLTLDYQTEVEGFVDAHLPVLLVSPIRLQHDDYHAGNVIVRDAEFQGIIDFGNCDWGDPIEDLYKVPWLSAAISVPFARGQIDGYLSGGPVPEFWLRYNLYVAMSFHSSLVWTHRHLPESLPLWRRKIKEIVETHDFRNDGPPLWYTQDIELIDVS